MTYELFWALLWVAAQVGFAWAVIAYAQRNDFELGAQAERDGLALNVGWSRKMKAGWGHSWRARHGLNDLGEELEQFK